MTKSFYFITNHPYDLEEEFDEFFDNSQEDFFFNWLTYSFEVVVMDNKINAVRCSLKDNVATFSIWWADCYTRPAGTANVTCATELLNEFWERIYNPENYNNSEGIWEN